MNKPRRLRIYKLSVFDTFTEEERALHEAYKKASKKTDKATLKKIRDDKLASYVGSRKIDREKLYAYDYDKDKNPIADTERENTDKQIALFESEIVRYANDFEREFPLVMEIVYMKIAYQSIVFKQILERGLMIADKKYVFYTSTTNQMKRGEFVLVEEDFWEKSKSKFMCGLTDDIINVKGGCNRGKNLAYKGLPLSTSFFPDGYEIDIDKCLLVSDFQNSVHAYVECIDIDHEKREIIGLEERWEDIEITQTDGAGIFLPGVLPASAQIRCGHLKGALFPFDFRKFLEQDEVEGIKPNPVITDAWGKVKHDIIKEDIQVLFTTSQLKLWGYYDSWEEFKEEFKKNNMKIAINKFADTEPKGYAKTSYQFIQTLSSEKLTDEKLEELCADTIEYLDKMKSDLNSMVKIMGNNDSYLAMAIEAYNDLVYDKHIQEDIEEKFRRERTEARGNKLILRDSLYSYICPDLYAFCTWLFCGIENPKGLVPKNYVYNSFFNEMDYDKVDCLRSPHLYVEHGIRNLVKGDTLEKCKEWFNDFDTIVSSHDLLCRLLMFDVDGDECLLTPNKTIIECVPDDIIPLYYKAFDAEKDEITQETIYEAIMSCIENTQIGDISNVMTKNYNNPDIDMEFNKIMCCYNNLSIDYPKTQKNIELGEYAEKYKRLKDEDCPHFFIYAKGKKEKLCKSAGNSNADRVCLYIHEKTGNKKYSWKQRGKTFNPSILFNQQITVDIKDERYSQLEDIMFKLKSREKYLASHIDKAIQELSKSDGEAEKKSKYDVFYYMCERLIMNIFNSREEATEYLLDLEYLQRDNDNRGKKILWNCFGDLIYKNICDNLCLANVRQRKQHYETSRTVLKEVAEKTIEKIKETTYESIKVYQDELEWIDGFPYSTKSKLDRELLYVLLVFQKRNHGKFAIYMNKKKAITCNTIDKLLGDGVCICKNGLKRLEKIGAISVNVVNRKYYEVTVNVPKISGDTVAFEVEQKNPLVAFYKNNGERKIASCEICGKDFIKSRNTKVCPSISCRNELAERRKRVGEPA